MKRPPFCSLAIVVLHVLGLSAGVQATRSNSFKASTKAADSRFIQRRRQLEGNNVAGGPLKQERAEKRQQKPEKRNEKGKLALKIMAETAKAAAGNFLFRTLEKSASSSKQKSGGKDTSKAPSARPVSTAKDPSPLPEASTSARLDSMSYIRYLLVETVKAAVADLIVQTVVEERTTAEIDWRRNGIFVFFGAIYMGIFHHWLIASRKLDRNEILDSLKRIPVELLLHLNLFHFVAFYTLREVPKGLSSDSLNWILVGWRTYLGRWQEDFNDTLQIWGPYQIFQVLLPTTFRQLFRQLISFYWMAYLSYSRVSLDNRTKPTVPP